MSLLSGVSTTLSSLLSSSTKKDSSTTDLAAAKEKFFAAKSDSLVNYLSKSSSTSSLDSYTPSMEYPASLMNRLSDSSSTDSSPYNVLTYGQTGQLEALYKKTQS